MLHKVFYLVAVLLWQAVAGGVGDVDDRCSCLYYRLYNAGEILIFGAACIFGIEFHIVDISSGIFHGGHGTLDNLLARGVEFVSDMRVRCADAGVYALVLGVFQCFRRCVDVFLHSAC